MKTEKSYGSLADIGSSARKIKERTKKMEIGVPDFGKTKPAEKTRPSHKNKNANQLMEELLKNVTKSKSEGNFDFEKISESIKQIMPYLTQEQQQNIMTILHKIK